MNPKALQQRFEKQMHAQELRKRGHFGFGIIQLREAKGMSSYKLAEVAGVSRSLLSLLESGDRRPNKPTIAKLSQALGVNPQVLLNWAYEDELGPEAEFIQAWIEQRSKE